MVFIYEFVTARLMPGGEWHGAAGYHEYKHWSCSSELGWLHLCNSTRLGICTSLGGLCSLPAIKAQISRASSIKLPTWSRDGLRALWIQKEGAEQEGLCVWWSSAAALSCALVFLTKRGQPVICGCVQPLVLWLWLLTQGFAVARQWWLRLPLGWCGHHSGLALDPALCPASLRPQSLWHPLPEPSPPLFIDSSVRRHLGGCVKLFLEKAALGYMRNADLCIHCTDPEMFACSLVPLLSSTKSCSTRPERSC